MIEGRRNLFRAVAFERYLRGRDRVVLPRYIRPGALVYLWAVLGVILGSATLAAAAPIPDHAIGTASILTPTSEQASPARLAVQVPAASAARVQPGQTVSVRTARGQLLTATIDTANGETVSPTGEPGMAFEAQLHPTATDDQTAELHPGLSVPAQIQVGTRPVWALFSSFGRRGEEE